MKAILRIATILMAAAAIPLSAPAQAETIKLRVAHFLPAVSNAHTNVIVPWCEKVEAESKGQLQCELYPAMQLGGNPGQLFGQARDGIADIVWTLPGYTPGRFPVSEVFELPFFTTTHEASSRALWYFIEKYAKREFAGVKPLATWVNGPNYLHLSSNEVHKLEDLAGLKIRAPSRLSNKLLERLGATPLGMPLPQAVESLSKGVIEGAMLPWEVVPGVKLQELANYHVQTTGPRTMATSTMIFVMNKRKYDSLSPELQKVIDDNSGPDTSAWVATQFRLADEVGLESAKKEGNTIYDIPVEEMERWREAALPVTQEWIKEISAKGLDGQALYDAAAALVAEQSK